MDVRVHQFTGGLEVGTSVAIVRTKMHFSKA